MPCEILFFLHLHGNSQALHSMSYSLNKVRRVPRKLRVPKTVYILCICRYLRKQLAQVFFVVVGKLYLCK